VQAANALGIAAVWFNATTDERRSGPMHSTVHDLDDLPRAMLGLGASTGGIS